MQQEGGILGPCSKQGKGFSMCLAPCQGGNSPPQHTLCFAQHGERESLAPCSIPRERFLSLCSVCKGIGVEGWGADRIANSPQKSS